MNVIVTDKGFGPDDFAGEFVALEDASGQSAAVDVPSDADPAELGDYVKAKAIRVDFPSFSDGRGFTIGRQLRLMGFTGRLRARGHVISDQYAMARRAGFDEVEISDELAARQPQEDWLFRADWQENDYQTRLRANK